MQNTITEERRAMRAENSQLSTLAVLQRLKADQPTVWELSEVVGRWVWVEFQAPPAPEVREFLLDLGFRYNARRRAWQHSCGFPTRHTSGDPRYKYGSAPAAAFAGATEELQAA